MVEALVSRHPSGVRNWSWPLVRMKNTEFVWGLIKTGSYKGDHK